MDIELSTVLWQFSATSVVQSYLKLEFFSYFADVSNAHFWCMVIVNFLFDFNTSFLLLYMLDVPFFLQRPFEFITIVTEYNSFLSSKNTKKVKLNQTLREETEDGWVPMRASKHAVYSVVYWRSLNCILKVVLSIQATCLFSYSLINLGERCNYQLDSLSPMNQFSAVNLLPTDFSIQSLNSTLSVWC